MWYYSHEETNKRQDHVCLLALCPLKVGHAFPSPWATASNLCNTDVMESVNWSMLSNSKSRVHGEVLTN